MPLELSAAEIIVGAAMLAATAIGVVLTGATVLAYFLTREPSDEPAVIVDSEPEPQKEKKEHISFRRHPVIAG